jgi:uncharacterized protein (TIGR00297 family)
MMDGPFPFVFFLLLAVGLCLRFRKLSTGGGLGAALVAAAIYSGLGWSGIILLGIFFLSATLATSWERSEKIRYEAGEERRGRNAGQVLANGGAAALMGLLALYAPDAAPLAAYLLAAALSAATADTLSSELGLVYGRGYFNLLTGKPDRKGENGVISREGLAFGLCGSLLLVLAFGLLFSNDVILLSGILIAGTAGNLADSLLGATLERKGILGNNGVNFLNTILALLVAWGWSLLF